MGFSRFVRSSFIQNVSYDDSRVRIIMKGGNTYDYDDVPAHVAEAVLQHPDESVGQWYNHTLKQGNYPHRRVRPVAGVQGV